MANDVKIIISAVDKASQTLKKVSGELDKTSKSGASGFKALAGSATAAWGALAAGVGVAVTVGTTIKKLADGFQDYAFEVKDFGRIIGASAEDASKLIQVADDVRLSTQSMTTAMRSAITKGYQPTVEELGRLADKYLSIQDPIQRSKFLIETFGRSGLEMAKLLELGSAKIQEMGDSIEGTSRLMTEEGVKAAEKYYAQLDNLGDKWDELKLTLGQAAVGAISFVIENTEKAITATQKWESQLDQLDTAYKRGLVSLQEYNAAMYNQLGEFAPKMEEVTKLVTRANEEYAKSFDGLEEKTRQTNAENNKYVAGLKLQAAASEDAIDNIKKLGSAMGSMSDITAALSEDLLYQKAAINLDVEAQLELGRAFGRVDENAIRLYRQLDRLNKIYDTNGDGAISAAEATGGYIQAVTRLRQEIAGLKSKTVDIVINFWDNRSRLAGALPQNGGYNPLATPTVNKAIEDAKLKNIPRTPPAQEKKDDAGGASGLSMVVPPGYPNDSFKIGATSGEQVDILTQAQQRTSGGMNVNIVINGANQSPQAIAQAVIAQLNRSMRAARQSGLGYVGA